jgi:hypothetical protein
LGYDGGAWMELCEIVGFRRGWTEFFGILACYAAWGGLKPTFREGLLIGLIFKSQDVQETVRHWFLKMGVIVSTETSILNHLTQYNNAGYRNSLDWTGLISWPVRGLQFSGDETFLLKAGKWRDGFERTRLWAKGVDRTGAGSCPVVASVSLVPQLQRPDW